MKYFALDRHDGGVEVMTLIPARALFGGKMLMTRIEGGEVQVPSEKGWRAFDPADGGELIYTTPEIDFEKWPEWRRAEIASFREITADEAVKIAQAMRAAKK